MRQPLSTCWRQSEGEFLKTNDITVCAFPKSGITYLGFLLMAARLKHNGGCPPQGIDLRPTFYNIDWLLIDTHKMSGVSAPLLPVWRDGLGEFYKTHATLTSVTIQQERPPNVIYLLRNPVDTLASYFHFRRQLGSADSIEHFLTGPEGIDAWIAHVSSWLIDNHNASQSLYLLHYEELLANPVEELSSLMCELGLSLTTATLTYAADIAEIDTMRALERQFAARNPVYARFNLEFVRPGELRHLPELTSDLIELIERKTRDVYHAARDFTGNGS